ncbi:hypothetical protein [Parendozoicomonas sp. Alg238-R29]|uniref:hypothetical protein n=1 Tax=Parendozoicomonas sp. Alg238-R29 TaxID=2993446 RepID=UPI00248D98CB|nr:hypothetical protein [Parendozoicomonas sp. Alg238-R29]
MNDDNLFAIAVENGETNSFFRGLGSYFSRNRENGKHAFISHMTGWVANYAKDNIQNSNSFDLAFLKYLESLTLCTDDFYSVQMNLIAYHRLKTRGLLPHSCLLESDSSPAVLQLEKFLTSYRQSKLEDVNFKNAVSYWSKIHHTTLAALFKKIDRIK